MIVRAVACVALASCGDPTLPEAWQLDHDRIVAVRASPPALAAGETASVTGLLASSTGPTREVVPDTIAVLAPIAVQIDRGSIVAPGPGELDAIRRELGLAPLAPIPVELEVGFDTRIALKTVWLGVHADNPVLEDITVDGIAAGSEILVPVQTDVMLSIAAGEDAAVHWLTSCGELLISDLAEGVLRVETPRTGELAVVVRDGFGGAAWRVWPIRAE